jgi:hypothetical protein
LDFARRVDASIGRAADAARALAAADVTRGVTFDERVVVSDIFFPPRYKSVCRGDGLNPASASLARSSSGVFFSTFSRSASAPEASKNTNSGLLPEIQFTRTL